MTTATAATPASTATTTITATTATAATPVTIASICGCVDNAGFGSGGSKSDEDGVSGDGDRGDVHNNGCDVI